MKQGPGGNYSARRTSGNTSISSHLSPVCVCVSRVSSRLSHVLASLACPGVARAPHVSLMRLYFGRHRAYSPAVDEPSRNGFQHHKAAPQTGLVACRNHKCKNPTTSFGDCSYNHLDPSKPTWDPLKIL